MFPFSKQSSSPVTHYHCSHTMRTVAWRSAKLICAASTTFVSPSCVSVRDEDTILYRKQSLGRNSMRGMTMEAGVTLTSLITIGRRGGEGSCLATSSLYQSTSLSLIGVIFLFRLLGPRYSPAPDSPSFSVVNEISGWGRGGKCQLAKRKWMVLVHQGRLISIYQA